MDCNDRQTLESCVSYTVQMSCKRFNGCYGLRWTQGIKGTTKLYSKWNWLTSNHSYDPYSIFYYIGQLCLIGVEQSIIKK